MKRLFTHLTWTSLIIAMVTLSGCSTPGRYSRSTGERLDDRTITSKVKSHLNDDSLTREADINVDTFRGNVHLTGFVDHPIQKERASDLVRETPGVQWFKNDIVVKTDLPSARTAADAPFREPAGASFQFESESGAKWQPGLYNYDRRVQEPAGAPMREDLYEQRKELRDELK